MEGLNLIVIGIFLFHVIPVFGAENDKLSGFYTAPSKCSMLNAKRATVACEKAKPDCLKLKRLSKYKVKLEIYSTQVLGSSCAVEGIATIVSGNNISLNLSDEYDSPRLIVNIKDKYLELEVSPKDHFHERCGVHASFQGLKFDRTKKQFSNAVCFSG